MKNLNVLLYFLCSKQVGLSLFSHDKITELQDITMCRSDVTVSSVKNKQKALYEQKSRSFCLDGKHLFQ